MQQMKRECRLLRRNRGLFSGKVRRDEMSKMKDNFEIAAGELITAENEDS